MACLSFSISSNLHSGFVCEARRRRRRRRREAAGSVQASETQFGEICSGSGSCLVSSAAAVAIRRRTSVRGRGGQSRVLTRKKNGIGSLANSGEEAAVAAAALRLPAVFFVGESGAVLLRRRLGYCIVEDDDDDDKKNKRDRRRQTTVIMSSSIDSAPSKFVKGAGGAILEDVPHLTDWLPGLPTYANPLKYNPAYAAVRQYFVEETDVVAKDVVVNMNKLSGGIYFRRAGPREKIYFKSEDVKAAVVTCGGLCPGLNTVIREIVCGLWTQYGVREIYGIVGGYRGFYSRNTIDLNPKVVNDIHKRGGTILRTSRGGHETSKIVDSIEDRGINQVYIIGGDGTQKGAWAIHKECVRRGLEVVVAGIPKTIDNDIDIIDKSFGFDTAVEEAQRAINAAHVEAESAQNGIGLVKLMGRYSGYIAMYATLASRDVDLCLIPEVPFYLEGPGGLYEFVEQRLRENGHMVIVVAEGAGQELMAESMGSHDNLIDASGNHLLLDVGLWLCQNLKEHFAKAHPTFKEPLNLKYIDPTYMVRAIPSNASDNVYCTLLAHSAIHGAMAGYCGFTAGPVNNRHCYIPIPRVSRTQRHVNVADRMWARLLSGTNQPDFLLYKVIIEEKRRAKALMQAEKMKKDAAEQTSKSPTTSPSQDSPTTVTNGNGSINNETTADNSKTQIVTGDRQLLPVRGSSLVTSPVPGEPTANIDEEAP